MFPKQVNRAKPSFANINLLGKCNVKCFFCLGEDIPQYLGKYNQLKTEFYNWPNFGDFLTLCKKEGITNLYITGQNTDALLYKHLWSLITNLQALDMGFDVGIRTNGYMFEKNMELVKTANLCRRSVGVSIHTLIPQVNEKIMGRDHIPDWDLLLPLFHNLRVSIVVNRYNVGEIPDILLYLKQFPNIRYVQLRRISTDTRSDKLSQDQDVFNNLARIFEKCGEDGDYKILEPFYGAKRYFAFGHEIVLWPTVSTSIGSFNYFTDGTISKKYFVIEGYLKENGITL
ncbi:hypothetical protein LCGC14_0856840 [marine sediment metagenome]|uniref:Radical SAM core domain-containing protein n=1 Tax=marine sediment metagenome TaxID=412755 RepID=A0A0F9SFK8_9ZZZZ